MFGINSQSVLSVFESSMLTIVLQASNQAKTWPWANTHRAPGENQDLHLSIGLCRYLSELLLDYRQLINARLSV